MSVVAWWGVVGVAVVLAVQAVLLIVRVWRSRLPLFPFPPPSMDPMTFIAGSGTLLGAYAREKRIFMYFHERLMLRVRGFLGVFGFVFIFANVPTPSPLLTCIIIVDLLLFHL
jgi:hypothetical protein